MTFTQLDPLHLDTLREMSNIGMGHAATALSQLLRRRITLHVPNLTVTEIAEVPTLLGGAETVVAGVTLAAPKPGVHCLWVTAAPLGMDGWVVHLAQGLPDTAMQSGHASGCDKFRGVYPKINWEVQLEHGEKIGLGIRRYNLVKLEPEHEKW